jgi:hypothetical protein
MQILNTDLDLGSRPNLNVDPTGSGSETLLTREPWSLKAHPGAVEDHPGVLEATLRSFNGESLSSWSLEGLYYAKQCCASGSG